MFIFFSFLLDGEAHCSRDSYHIVTDFFGTTLVLDTQEQLNEYKQNGEIWFEMNTKISKSFLICNHLKIALEDLKNTVTTHLIALKIFKPENVA